MTGMLETISLALWDMQIQYVLHLACIYAYRQIYVKFIEWTLKTLSLSLNSALNNENSSFFYFQMYLELCFQITMFCIVINYLSHKH